VTGLLQALSNSIDPPDCRSDSPPHVPTHGAQSRYLGTADAVQRLLPATLENQPRYLRKSPDIQRRTVYSLKCTSLPKPDILMIPHNPLQQLRDLGRTSLQLYNRLWTIWFIHGNDYQDISSQQNEYLTWLVGYLDNVSLQTTSPHSVLNATVGSRQYLRSHKSRIPGIPT
jgi:hypothetical protein